MADPRDLMARYQDGDASAFRELYAQVAPRLLGYLMKMARSRAVADDLLQQTFLKVHRARAAYIRGTDPLPWIYSIAHRTFLDEARKQKRAIVNVAKDADADLPEAQASITGDALGAVDEPVDSEKTKAALDALAKLPAQQREAVVLTKLEGKSVAEAAEIAGTTVGAMKVRAHRGYEALRKLLGAVADASVVKKAAAGFIVGALLGPLGVVGVAAALAVFALSERKLNTEPQSAQRPEEKRSEEKRAEGQVEGEGHVFGVDRELGTRPASPFSPPVSVSLCLCVQSSGTRPEDTRPDGVSE